MFQISHRWIEIDLIATVCGFKMVSTRGLEPLSCSLTGFSLDGDVIANQMFLPALFKKKKKDFSGSLQTAEAVRSWVWTYRALLPQLPPENQVSLLSPGTGSIQEVHLGQVVFSSHSCGTV